MKEFEDSLFRYSSFVLLGEAGCGKSELAVNLAIRLARRAPTELYDLDQTKVLFRARDLKELLERSGVELHYGEQLLDTPTAVGGAEESLRDRGRYTILDVGGSDAGARLIGRYARLLQGEHTGVYYLINRYRPWSDTVEHVAETLSAVLTAARLREVHFLANPNLGAETTPELVLAGLADTERMLAPHARIEAACVEERFYERLRWETEIPLLPIRRYMTQDWA